MARRKSTANKNLLFHEYFIEWVETYKEGHVRQVTLNKYLVTHKQLELLAPRLLLSEMTRRDYQKIINDYALTHERQTTMDFHHQVKAAVQDAFHDGLLDRDASYKAVIKGRKPKPKKQKFLSNSELKKLIATLDLSKDVNVGWDWFILFLAKTGVRFAEGLAITPNDFDLKKNTLTVNKTWEYKLSSKNTFAPTKNQSSVREIVLDWQIIGQLVPKIMHLPPDEPIFVDPDKRIHNSIVNTFLRNKCIEAGVTVVTVHALRHTHASVLMASGISMHSISQRLGHSNVTTTQEIYAHVIDELKEKDDNLMMQALSGL